MIMVFLKLFVGIAEVSSMKVFHHPLSPKVSLHHLLNPASPIFVRRWKRYATPMRTRWHQVWDVPIRTPASWKDPLQE